MRCHPGLRLLLQSLGVTLDGIALVDVVPVSLPAFVAPIGTSCYATVMRLATPLGVLLSSGPNFRWRVACDLVRTGIR